MTEYRGYIIYRKDDTYMVYYHPDDDGAEFNSLEDAMRDIDEFLED